MFDDNDVSTLNGLIATTRDSIAGYRDASTVAGTNSRFTGLFTSFANDREQVVAGLSSAVSAAGGTPDHDGTVLGAAHRTFLDLKSKITGSDDKSIIDTIESGEDHLKAKFESALADDKLQPATIAAIQTAWTSIKSGHDRISALKHEMHADA